MKHPDHRETIALEAAEVISHQAFDGDQYILRLQAPECATLAQPGQFAHLSCDPMLAMRRPLSIMRVDAEKGWVDFLYKAVGRGTRLLANREAGETLSLLGPIGKPFTFDPSRPRALLLGGGVGIPPMVFFAEHLKNSRDSQPLVLMGSEVPFPFTGRPSRIMVPGMPDGVIAAMPLLDDWGVASRLASLQGYSGCFEGYITDLARRWLDEQNDEQRRQISVYACGPHPMLAAVAKLANDYKLSCQVSLEEYMACAVGGCAGCVVKVQTPEGAAMKRVCVDGPVFEASTVF
ncbi:dihydroorotate oxidase B electron transfer subunit [Thiogranum longum]|uniref:Dihydroorotate oxidase B electron transfer subunit n=1 Tax=Thiogranum longum TaxID=1537524 RepID=A0A4R1H9H3_9GAMM|nr:dihydroorotate dehydrogenase electron transfer subunit [Thiogranum longum]TCK17133.1 dihydroorotate oxidase B electron transfer subunit [Thiogranum longum]